MRAPRFCDATACYRRTVGVLMSPTTGKELVHYRLSALEELLESMRYDYRRYADMRNSMHFNPLPADFARSHLYRKFMWTCVLILFIYSVLTVIATIYSATDPRDPNVGAASVPFWIMMTAVYPGFGSLAGKFRQAAKQRLEPHTERSIRHEIYAQFPDQERVTIQIVIGVFESRQNHLSVITGC